MPINGGSLPNISNLQQLLPSLKIWQQRLNRTIQKPQAPRAPFNLKASSMTGATAVLLEWEPVRGADGYIVYSSDVGDFSDGRVAKVQANPMATTWTDNLVIAGKTRFYRVSATSGTIANPRSVVGNPSVVVSIASGHNAPLYSPPPQPPPSRSRGTTACFTGTCEIRMGSGGYQRFDQLPTDAPFEILNETGSHMARLIVHENWSGVMIDFTGDRYVTLDHAIKRGTDWVPASDFWPNAPRVRVQGISVYNLEIESSLEVDKHYCLRNIVAHNYELVNPD